MRKIHAGVATEIELQVVPVLVVVAYFFAVCADGNEVFQSGEVGDVLHHQQASFFMIILDRTSGDQHLNIFGRHPLLDLQSRASATDGLTIKAPFYGIADHAVRACRTSTAALWDVGRMEAMQYIAASASINGVLGGFRERSGSSIQVQDF